MENNELVIDVLLVEDNPDDSELTIHAMNLGKNGNHLLHLKDGVQALNFIFARKEYSDQQVQGDLKLVLLDLNLPRIDGLEVLRKIRADVKTRMLPVVIFTSSKEIRDIKEAYKLLVNSYVVKPISYD